MEQEECGITRRWTHCWADDAQQAYLIVGLNNSHRRDLVLKGETAEVTRSMCWLEADRRWMLTGGRDVGAGFKVTLGELHTNTPVAKQGAESGTGTHP